MKPTRFIASALLVLAGCASAPPISEAPIPAADAEACEAIASQAPAVQDVTEAAAVSGAKGYVIDTAIKGAAAKTGARFFGSTITSTTTISAPPVASLFIVIGVIEGLREVRKERARIVRECLRDRGHRVY